MEKRNAARIYAAWDGGSGGAVCVLTGALCAAAFAVLLFLAALSVDFLHADGALIPALILIAALGAGSFLLYRLRLPEHGVLCGILLFGLALRLAMIFLVPTEPGQDFAFFYNGARSILAGDRGWTENYYFVLYPNLIPICYYYALLLSISDSILFCKLINLVFMTGVHVLLTLSSARLAGGRAARIVSMIYAVSPAVLLTSTQLTNQHVSLFLLFLSVYLIMRSDNLILCACAGACAALGNGFRSEGIVISLSVGALMILLLVDAMRARSRKLILSRLLFAGCFFAGMALFSALLSFAFSRASGVPVNNDSSYQWKIVVGLDDAESGTYSDANLDAFSEKLDSTEIIKAELSDGRDWGDFFVRKMRAMWAYPEDPVFSFWNIDGNTRVAVGPLDTDVNGLLRRGLLFDRALLLSMYICTAIAALRLLLAPCRRTPALTLFTLVFMANFSAYVLIEVAPRYRYFILPFMLVLAVNAFFARQNGVKSELYSNNQIQGDEHTKFVIK